MIINISGRTDIVTYYSDWMFRRFEEGFVYSRNSLFPNSVRRYELIPDKIDCIIFGSKNYSPVLPRIHEITDRFATYFYYSITAYGKDIEPNIPSIDQSIKTLIELSKIVGSSKIAWRYDPILLTDIYTIEQHIQTFNYIAKELSGFIDCCIFSFVEMYKKHETNFPELITMTTKDKDRIAKEIGRISKQYNISLQTCGPEEDYSNYVIQDSDCVTLEMLSRANNLEFRKLKHKGFREGYHCMESRDIGALNSCLSGCKYCYANKNNVLPKKNYQLHDINSPLLIGHLKETDRLQPALKRHFKLIKNTLHNTSEARYA